MHSDAPDLLIIPWPAAAAPRTIRVLRYRCARCECETVERGELRRNAVCNVYDVGARRFCGGALELVARELQAVAPPLTCDGCGRAAYASPCGDCGAVVVP